MNMVRRQLWLAGCAIAWPASAVADAPPQAAMEARFAGPFDMANYCPIGDSGIELGALPNEAGARSYEIPQRISQNAAWIQAFVYLNTGGGHVNGLRMYRISSEPAPYKRVQYFIQAYAYPQPAWSYNSENIWLPAPASGKIESQRVLGARLGGHWRSSVRLVGYLRRDGSKECVAS